MPHTSRKKPVNPGWKPAEFVAVTLTPEDKERIKATIIDAAAIDDSLAALTRDGYKLSIKLDAYNACFACYLIGAEGSRNAGYILTGRGTTPLKAVRQCLYIHFVLFSGDWPQVLEPMRGELDD